MRKAGIIPRKQKITRDGKNKVRPLVPFSAFFRFLAKSDWCLADSESRCGLCDDAGGERHLMAGHDETRKEFFISKVH